LAASLDLEDLDVSSRALRRIERGRLSATPAGVIYSK
jgi:hypothetical protein